jgi:hypothetical protein
MQRQEIGMIGFQTDVGLVKVSLPRQSSQAAC